MPGSPYTGNPTAVQAPSAQPGEDVAPIETLPNDGDPANAASVAQALKVPADFLAYLASRASFGAWLYSATDATIAADTDLTLGHAFYRNLTINAGKKLTMLHPGIIFVSGTLTFGDAASKIIFGKKVGFLNGANAAASTRGFGGAGWAGDAFGQIGGGGSGGGGGADGHVVPDAGFGVGSAGGTGWGGGGSALGGAGGAGGAGAHAGAAAGTLYSFFAGAAETEAQALLMLLMNGGWGFARGGADGARVAIPFMLEGGAGGGGGGGTATNTSTAGGGAGAGGAVGLVIARKAIIVADGCIQAPGGDGGAGFGGGGEAAGGGGPGGGGFVGLVYGSKTGPALTAANCCPAGTPGAGANGGAAGAAGATGNVREYQVGI
jgi:hypothetical protein